MTPITITGTRNIMGKEVPIAVGGFAAGQKCISDKTIAVMHGQPEREIRRRIKDNIIYFKQDVDFLDLKKDVDENHDFAIYSQLGYSRMEIAKAEHIYLLSQRGYDTLAKIMGGMDTWNIHDQFVSEYFAADIPATKEDAKDSENAIIVTGMQPFMGKEIPVVLGGFGSDAKCICDKTVAELHDMESFHVRELIGHNSDRFMDGIDVIDVKKTIVQNDGFTICSQLGYSKTMISHADHIYLLSQRGYLKLVKIMDNDLAWEIYNRLLDEYFMMRAQLQSKAELSDIPKELKMFKLLYDSLVDAVYEQKRQAEALESMTQKVVSVENKVSGIRDVVSLNTDNWREDCRHLLAQISKCSGKTYAEVYSECYEWVNRRAGVSLQRRLDNRRDRMKKEGISKTKQEQYTAIDVIAEDKKLIEIYIAVVKDMALKYGAEKQTV